MGHLNLPSSKRIARQWKLLDLVTAAFFGAVFVFFLLVFTPLGDSLAASGRQALSAGDPKQRQRLAALVELGHQQTIDACPADMVDHVPCEDPRRNSQLSREMNFYRERHCPSPEETPLCLIPPPEGYQLSVQWPESLHKIWHSNVPHNKIADRKGHQGWMKEEGPYFIFPGGGTMFQEGATQYIKKLKQYIPISGGTLRTALDMGCGVASFGGYMLNENMLTLSFAPRDSHKAQIQFALERGVPAFVAMLGTRRLPFPAFSFDLVHCSRCLIPFTAYNASYFIEVDRLLRPGGYLVISGPPVQWPKQDKEWADVQAVERSLCYELIAVDGNTAIWKKPNGDSCLPNQNEFGLGLCDESDDPSFAWYFRIKKCVTRISSVKGELAVGSIPKWPDRLTKAPSRATVMKNGIDVFDADSRRCEPFSTYPRSYDFIHVAGIESLIKTPGSGKSRCNLVDLMVEMDRILRPEGTVVIRDAPEVIEKVGRIAHAVRWTTDVYEKEPESHGREKILVASKIFWKLSSSSH
ncbi:putative S-adenosyl-L-methionine-dependent methyltransferase [Dillenia turbinata]|uniref:Methyltransferase n=1 Tax=Dillenia turbinata TaxID=194707 RepID=A0AAN8V3A9_9MAGN